MHLGDGCDDIFLKLSELKITTLDDLASFDLSGNGIDESSSESWAVVRISIGKLRKKRSSQLQTTSVTSILPFSSNVATQLPVLEDKCQEVAQLMSVFQIDDARPILITNLSGICSADHSLARVPWALVVDFDFAPEGSRNRLRSYVEDE